MNEPKLPELILNKFKTVMKEVLTQGEALLDSPEKYRSFKSYIMYSTYHNFRSLCAEFAGLNLLEKNHCSCQIETKRDHQDKTCVCLGTEFIENEKFIDFRKDL